MKTFVKVLEHIDFTGWAVLKQDMYPASLEKPFLIAKRTREYLRKIGLGLILNNLFDRLSAI